MTPADLDTLAATLAQMTKGPWHLEYVRLGGFTITARSGGHHWVLCSRNEIQHKQAESEANAAGIVALVNAKDELIRLARLGLKAERETCETCRHQYMLSRPDVTYCEVVDRKRSTLGHRCGSWEGRTA